MFKTIAALSTLNEFANHCKECIETNMIIINTEQYTYHTTFTFIFSYSYFINYVQAMNIPVTFKVSTSRIYSVILQFDSELNIQKRPQKSITYRTNWKLQHQRHQVVKLLQITG